MKSLLRWRYSFDPIYDRLILIRLIWYKIKNIGAGVYHFLPTQISLCIRTVWSVSVVRLKTLWILDYPQSTLRRFWPDCVDAYDWSEYSLATQTILVRNTQEMPQSRSIDFPRHQKKEGWGTITKTLPHMKPPKHNEELQQRNRAGWSGNEAGPGHKGNLLPSVKSVLE